jgi:hypothetical protein
MPLSWSMSASCNEVFYIGLEHNFFLGIRSTFYRLSMLTGNGLIVIIGGYLEQEYGDKQKAWSYTMMSGSSWQY